MQRTKMHGVKLLHSLASWNEATLGLSMACHSPESALYVSVSSPSQCPFDYMDANDVAVIDSQDYSLSTYFSPPSTPPFPPRRHRRLLLPADASVPSSPSSPSSLPFQTCTVDHSMLTGGGGLLPIQTYAPDGDMLAETIANSDLSRVLSEI